MNLKNVIKKTYSIRGESGLKDGKFVVFKEPTGEKFLLSLEEYDENGNLILEETFNSEGASEKWIYNYNSNSNCIEKIKNPASSLSEKFNYEYDGEKKIKEVWTRKIGTNIIPIEKDFLYNEDILIETNAISTQIDYFDKWKFQYDHLGQMVKKTGLFKNGRPHHEHFYKYDENGNCIQEEYYRKAKLNYRNQYFYENGLMVSKLSRNKFEPKFYYKSDFIYENGLKIKAFNYLHSCDDPVSITFYEYEDK